MVSADSRTILPTYLQNVEKIQIKEINSSVSSLPAPALYNDGHFHTVKCNSHRYKPGADW